MLKSVELREELDTIKAEASILAEKEDATTEEINAKMTAIKDLKARIEAQEAIENELRTEIENKAEKMEVITNMEDKIMDVKNEIRNYFATGKVQDIENAIDTTAGAGVVFKQLSGDIIALLKERSSAFGFFNQTSIKGIAKIPVQSSTSSAVWVDEGTDPGSTPDAGLTVIELGQNRLYKESALTQQMVNSQEIDLEAFVKEDITTGVLDTVEAGIFTGTGTKQMTGLCSNVPTGNQITVAARGTIAVADIKKAKAKLKKSSQKTARWFMHPDTFLYLDTLVDGQNRPLLQPDLTQSSVYMLLGSPVELTEAMPSINDTGAKQLIIYATPDAFHINIAKDVQLYVYNDSPYTKKGLVGFGADLYIDGKPCSTQNLAGIINKAS